MLFCVTEFMETKHFTPLDLSLIKFVLWKVLQQKLYSQDFRDVYQLKHVLIQRWLSFKKGRTKWGAKPTAKKRCGGI